MKHYKLKALDNEHGWKKKELKSGAKLMCFTQLYDCRDHLAWGGLNYESLVDYVRYFGAVTVLVFMCFRIGRAPVFTAKYKSNEIVKLGSD